jgi:hypothetical protein
MENLMQSTWTSTLAALALCAASTIANAQHPPITVTEASVETSANLVHLPPTLAGTIQLLGCPQCRLQSLQLGSDSKFFLNFHEISLEQLSTEALNGAGKPLTIHYRLSDSIVTRVELAVLHP